MSAFDLTGLPVDGTYPNLAGRVSLTRTVDADNGLRGIVLQLVDDQALEGGDVAVRLTPQQARQLAVELIAVSV